MDSICELERKGCHSHCTSFHLITPLLQVAQPLLAALGEGASTDRNAAEPMEDASTGPEIDEGTRPMDE